MVDFRREELEAEFFAEDPGAVAARLHNAWEGYWAALEAGEEAVRPDADSAEVVAERVENEVLEAKFS